jgi:elongation factor P
VSTIPCADLRRGAHVVRNGELLVVIDHELRTPGNLPSKLRIWFKSVRTGAITDLRLHPDDRIEVAHLETREVTYLYRDGERFVFLDVESCDQPELPRSLVEPLIALLKEGDPATLTVCDGEPIRVE